ncbi:nuclear transport factor 2 family protein [Blastococcus sp. HT6-30]|uniref:nuclear transport factor 2 family protein n=1 Tax=Blastococcus sp. HT6-30 TaxID=3144843 RepID=UPI003219D84E
MPAVRRPGPPVGRGGGGGPHRFAEQFFREWTGAGNRGDWPASEAMLHEDVTLFDPLESEPAVGRTAVLARAKAQYAPFPDGRVDVVGVPFATADRSAFGYRWRFVGTHERPIEPPGFAPTGVRLCLEGMSYLQLEQGRVGPYACTSTPPR